MTFTTMTTTVLDLYADRINGQFNTLEEAKVFKQEQEDSADVGDEE